MIAFNAHSEVAPRRVELADCEPLGTEAVRKIAVVNFPTFLVVDDKGNDLFEAL